MNIKQFNDVNLAKHSSKHMFGNSMSMYFYYQYFLFETNFCTPLNELKSFLIIYSH